jgi:hypothetical protein
MDRPFELIALMHVRTTAACVHLHLTLPAYAADGIHALKRQSVEGFARV